jgi:hypothetical protein
MKPTETFAISLATFFLAVGIFVSMLGGVSSIRLILTLFHVIGVLAFVSLGTAIHSAYTIRAARWFLVPAGLFAAFAAYILLATYLGGGGPIQVD